MDMSGVRLIAPIILSIMMFGMGLSLVFNDFKRIWIQPKAILLGSALQLLLLPIVGYVLAKAFALPPVLAVGLMVLVACPGGPGSNLVAFLSRGDAALSVSLTAISSLLAVFTIPLVVNFGVSEFMPSNPMEFSAVKTSLLVLIITVIPVTLGMVIARSCPAFDKYCERPVKIISIVFLLLLVVSTFAKARHNLLELIQDVGLPTILLCVVTMLIGYLSAKFSKLDGRACKTIAIEVGIQNSALAIVVATTLLSDAELAVPAAMYSPVMITACMLFLLHALLTSSGKMAGSTLVGSS